MAFPQKTICSFPAPRSILGQGDQIGRAQYAAMPLLTEIALLVPETWMSRVTDERICDLRMWKLPQEGPEE